MGRLLTDVDSVRQYLQETVDQDAQNDDIEVLIVQASDAIPRYCKREFGVTDGETRGFEFRPESIGPSQSSIVVNTLLYELRAVSKVVLDPDLGDGVELSAEKYRLWSYPPTPERTFWGIRLAETIPAPAKPLVFPTRRVDITGDWGTAEIPDLIRRYANEAVAAWLELPPDGRVFNAAEAGGEAPARPDDLPAGVRWGLSRTFMRPLFPA
jgi:hypothetical protein